jgi:hypothetical protein
MDHPVIAKVFDDGTMPQGRPYFAMEYVKGEPITACCDRHRLSTVELQPSAPPIASHPETTNRLQPDDSLAYQEVSACGELTADLFPSGLRCTSNCGKAKTIPFLRNW